MGGEAALVVATWGMPAQWRTVSYSLDGGKLEFCTTLPLLLRKFPGADVALLVLDSIVDASKVRGERGSACYECYEKNRGLVEEAANADSYQKLRELLRSFVEEYVTCLLERCAECLPEDSLSKRLRVVVCPAVGSPGGSWLFRGRASDFEAVALRELGLLCVERPYCRIALDLSHGVNFMPALALRAVEKLAGVLLTAHKELLDKGVEVFVYNSDPAPPGAGGGPLALNEVARARIKSVPVPSALPEKLLRERERLEEKERVNSVNSSYKRASRLALSALHYPMPLVLCAAKGRAAESIKVLNEAFEIWLKGVEVRREGPGVVVERRISLDPEAVYALLLAGSAARRLEGVEYPTPIEKLKELARLYEAVNESYRYLVMNELGLIEEALGEGRVAGGAPLYEVLGGERRGEVMDKRVMIAHAGLQKEFVEVVEGRKLRYTVSEEELERKLEEGGLLIRVSP